MIFKQFKKIKRVSHAVKKIKMISPIIKRYLNCDIKCFMLVPLKYLIVILILLCTGRRLRDCYQFKSCFAEIDN